MKDAPIIFVTGAGDEEVATKAWKAGLADFKFHDLRKTFGSLLAQNGVSTAVAQRLLEHSSQ